MVFMLMFQRTLVKNNMLKLMNQNIFVWKIWTWMMLISTFQGNLMTWMMFMLMFQRNLMPLCSTLLHTEDSNLLEFTKTRKKLSYQ
uniref:Uncharacterized protein n=1 Tax=Octopus bimaculoides TaxID=37653 RepID=A0A0L8G0B9_OCTBM